MVCAILLRPALVLLFLAACTTSVPPPAAEQTAPAETMADLPDLVGTWDVSLYYSPDAEPSKTEMIITGVDDGLLKGSFYQSDFSDGSRVAMRGNTIAFTGKTTDGEGEYVHSGRLAGEDIIEGQTLAAHRNFLMIWTAERTVSSAED